MFCCLMTWVFFVADCASAAPPEPDAYRLDHYRDAVPVTLRGGRVLDTQALVRFIATDHPILVDVLPAPVPPADLRPGLPRMPVPQLGLPGSIWLPEVGRGALSPAMESWFRDRLRAATGHMLDRPLVFYCLSRCWMSWNAARRALTYGYRNVVWYPDGADGWQAAGLKVTAMQPMRP
jgi:PQQ-dependent catabolism-associated CXXCW motif protein